MTERDDKILLQCQRLERAISLLHRVAREFEQANMQIEALEIDMIIKKRESQLRGVISREYPRVFKKGALK